MREITNLNRTKRLIDSTIEAFSLDLSGITVLTETASGPFVLTPIIAALAGAKQVIAVTKDSRYGSASEVIKYSKEVSSYYGVDKKILITAEPSINYANKADLVTNLGFVRPLNKEFVESLSKNSAISLMWETWEYRKEDLDLEECNRRRIPVLGTKETDSRLQIYKYIGCVALKLLFEINIEVFKSNILLLGSGPFAKEIYKSLVLCGAEVLFDEIRDDWTGENGAIKDFVRRADAVILAEHLSPINLIGGDKGVPLSWLAQNNVDIIHICGRINDKELSEFGLSKYPGNSVPFGYMTVTTDYVGPLPVIELHTAGLKVGEALVRGMRLYGNRDKAVAYALAVSPAVDF